MGARFTPDDFGKALTYYKKAIEIDPNYSRAYAALAQTYWALTNWGWYERVGVLSWVVARLLAAQYLESSMKNPTSIAHQVASSMNMMEYQHEEAIAEAERAIILDRNDPSAHNQMGWALGYAGRPEEAVDFAKTATRLDPHNPAHSLVLLGFAYFCMGQMEKAVNSVESAHTLNPETKTAGLDVLSPAYTHLGRDEEAHAALDKYMEPWWPKLTLRQVMAFLFFKDPEDAERFADGLLKAGLSGQPSGYYKISQEQKLTADEVKTLWFGRTHSGVLLTGQEWWIDCGEDGKATKRGAYIEGGSDTGTNWMEGERLCIQWQEHAEGHNYSGYVYRNPEGTSETKDEYLYVSFLSLMPFSPID